MDSEYYGYKFEPTKDLYDRAFALVKQSSENFLASRIAEYNVDGVCMKLVRFLNPPYDIYLKKIGMEEFQVSNDNYFRIHSLIQP